MNNLSSNDIQSQIESVENLAKQLKWESVKDAQKLLAVADSLRELLALREAGKEPVALPGCEDWISHNGKGYPQGLHGDEMIFIITRKQELKLPYPARLVRGWNHFNIDFDIMAYRLAAAPQLPAVPDGWVMVPEVPTDHMIVEGFESEPDETFSEPEVWEAYESMSGCQQAAHRAKLCWAAMIAAAPKPE